MKPRAGNSQPRKLSTGVAIALNEIGFTKVLYETTGLEHRISVRLIELELAQRLV
jgi:hypothetical protein